MMLIRRVLTVILALFASFLPVGRASAEQAPAPPSPAPAVEARPVVPAVVPRPAAAPRIAPAAAVAAQEARDAIEAAEIAEALAAAEAVGAVEIHVESGEIAAAVAAAEAVVGSVAVAIRPAELERLVELERLADEASFIASRVAGAFGTADADLQAVVAVSGDQESRLYNEARAAVDKAQWERAIERYSQVVEMKGARADAALYWKAFAQDRQGMRAEALATIAALGRDYPKSRYVQQAKVLEAEIRQKSGQPVRPQDHSDDEIKLMALNALQHSAPEQAVPMLEKLLHGTASPRVKERALFVLAQSSAPQAREVLRSVARGGSMPELQGRAITYLAQHGGPESHSVLAEVYASTADADVKRSVLRAYTVSGDRERLLAAAQSEQDRGLRTEAVRQLGVMNAHAELGQLYAREADVQVKKHIIRAMFVGGNAARMIELAKSDPNAELRREAVRNLGMMGAKGPAGALQEIYAAERDPEVKRAVIHALAVQDNATTLVALARKEQDQALRAEIVRRLSTMNNKVASDYMLEILGGK